MTQRLRISAAFWPVLGLGALISACPLESAPLGPETTFLDHWTPVDPLSEGQATLDPPPDGKAAARLSVAQLRRSISALFGTTWTITNGQNELQMFTVLSRTLGEADYLQATINNLEPSPLFAKLMDDMAADVCDKAITSDLANPDLSTRLVISSPTDADETLRFLRLKLHGIYVAEGSRDGLQDLRQLYDDTLAGSDARSAWFSVCVAMLTAPELMAF